MANLFEQTNYYTNRRDDLLSRYERLTPAERDDLHQLLVTTGIMSSIPMAVYMLNKPGVAEAILQAPEKFANTLKYSADKVADNLKNRHEQLVQNTLDEDAYNPQEKKILNEQRARRKYINGLPNARDNLSKHQSILKKHETKLKQRQAAWDKYAKDFPETAPTQMEKALRGDSTHPLARELVYTQNKVKETQDLVDAYQKRVSVGESLKNDATQKVADVEADYEYSKTPEGQQFQRAKQQRLIDQKFQKVDMNPKIKGKKALPYLGAMGAIGATNYMLNPFGEYGDNLRKNADFNREHTPYGKGFSNDLASAQDGLAYIPDFLGYAPGVGSMVGAGVIGSGLASEYLKNKYNINNDPSGMNRRQAVAQSIKDTGTYLGNRYDAVKQNLGTVGHYMRPSNYFVSADDKLKYDIAQENRRKSRAASDEKLFRDPRYKEYERRNKIIEADEIRRAREKDFLDANKKDYLPREDGIKRYLVNKMDDRVKYIRSEIGRTEQRLSDLMENRVLTPEQKLEKDNLVQRVKDYTTEVDNIISGKQYVMSSSDSTKLLDDTKLGRFNGLNEPDPTLRKRIKEEALAAKAQFDAKVNNFATENADSIDKTKEKIADIPEKTKGFMGKVGDKVQNIKEKIPGMGRASTSQELDPITDKPKSKPRGKIRGAINTAGLLSTPAGLWHGASLLNEFGNSKDKRQFAEDTGNSVYDALKNTAKDYKTMYDQSAYLPMAGKLTKEVILPTIRDSGKALWNIGAMTYNNLTDDKTTSNIADMESDDWFSTLDDRVRNGKYVGPRQNETFRPSLLSNSQNQEIKAQYSTPNEIPTLEQKQEQDQKKLQEKYINSMDDLYNYGKASASGKIMYQGVDPLTGAPVYSNTKSGIDYGMNKITGAQYDSSPELQLTKKAIDFKNRVDNKGKPNPEQQAMQAYYSAALPNLTPKELVDHITNVRNNSVNQAEKARQWEYDRITGLYNPDTKDREMAYQALQNQTGTASDLQDRAYNSVLVDRKNKKDWNFFGSDTNKWTDGLVKDKSFTWDYSDDDIDAYVNHRNKPAA